MKTFKEIILEVLTEKLYIGMWFGTLLTLIVKPNWDILIIFPLCLIAVSYGFENLKELNKE